MRPGPSNDVSVIRLVDTDMLSVRALNVCYANQIKTLPELIEFYYKERSFKNLRNCGTNTDKELSSICLKYKEIFISDLDTENNPTIDINPQQVVSRLDPFKSAIILRYIKYLQTRLSVRANNGLKQLISQHQGSEEWIEVLYGEKWNLSQVRNIGEKSITELHRFKCEIADFIDQLDNLTGEELGKEYTKLIIRTTFNEPDLDEAELVELVCDKSGKVRLFHLIDLLVDWNLLFEGNRKEVFLHCFSSKKTKSLDEIGQVLNLTRERVRQIKLSFIDDFSDHFGFIPNFNIDDLVDYGIASNSDVIVIDEKYADRYNSMEGVFFTCSLYGHVIRLLLNQTHNLITLSESFSRRYNSKGSSFYVVKREYCDVFNFSDFLRDVNAKLVERILESYELHFEGYLVQFAVSNYKPHFNSIKSICLIMLVNEFEMVPSVEDHLCFEKNTKRPLTSYIYEALEVIDNAAKVDVITEYINQNFVDDIITSEDSVRATLQRSKELFTPLGRSSLYGLRKWEKEKEAFMGGTIKDLVEIYLSDLEHPKHISEIIRYINRYRTTNEVSVKTNLESDESGRFKLYPGDFVGLSRITYKDLPDYQRVSGVHFTNLRFTRMQGWDVTEVIKYFADNHNYLPIQVQSIIEKRVSEGRWSISKENKLYINE